MVNNVLIILPAFNEEQSIKNVIESIQVLENDYDILVIDDCSTDNTYLVSSKMVPTLKLSKNLGIGGAVQTGIKYAKMYNYQFCIQIDGDGQHLAREIPLLLDKYNDSNASIIIGSRYLDKKSFRSTFLRRFGSKIISLSIMIFFKGKKISDPTSGMRLLDKKSISIFCNHYPADFPEPVSIAWALKSGLDVSETTVEMSERQYGETSIQGLNTVIYMIKVIFYIILARFFSII